MSQWYALYSFTPGQLWPGTFLGWLWASPQHMASLIGWANCTGKPDGSQLLALDQQRAVRGDLVC